MWFVTSKIGLTIIGTTIGLLGIWLGVHLFAEKHYDRGYATARGEEIARTAAANIAQAKENERRNALASEIAKAADAAGENVVQEADTTTNQNKEAVHNVYVKPPRTRPVSPGNLVHPLDRRVQARIDAAVDQANGK
jgi:hypothetical protein